MTMGPASLVWVMSNLKPGRNPFKQISYAVFCLKKKKNRDFRPLGSLTRVTTSNLVLRRARHLGHRVLLLSMSKHRILSIVLFCRTRAGSRLLHASHLLRSHISHLGQLVVIVLG